LAQVWPENDIHTKTTDNTEAGYCSANPAAKELPRENESVSVQNLQIRPDKETIRGGFALKGA